MKAAVYSQAGKKVKDVELAESVFSLPVNQKLLSQYTHVYLSNQRESVADTKDRGEVSGGGRKPWRQKGTGNARAGSTRSPLWRKGGVTFGPLSTRNWKKAMNKKMRQAAIRHAFSLLNKNEAITLVDSLNFADNQLTKQASDALKNLKIQRKTLIVLPEINPALIKAFSNLPKVKTALISELNAYDLLTTQQVVLLEPTLEYINSHWSKN